MKPPIVVLIGRTNAGKSTLFNRLTEHGAAIVSLAENTTRDQNRDLVYWKGAVCELIDTGGLDTAVQDDLGAEIQKQVQRAIDQADTIVLVVDGRGELMPQDKTLLRQLAKQNKPVVVCINKVDNARWRQHATGTFATLHQFPMALCSALNGSGTGDLLDTVFSVIRHAPAPTSPITQTSIQLALVGRPNAGKSTLFNALVGEDRVIVSPLPHTTRDTNDSELIYQGQSYTLIDTAGIRRQNRVGKMPERVVGQIERKSVRTALEMIERSAVTILLLEAQRRLEKQDKALLRYALQHGKGLIVALNKWDLVPDKSPSTITKYTTYFTIHLELPDYIPFVFISALEGQRVTQLLDMAKQVHDYRSWRAPQAVLDSILKSVLAANPKRRTIKGHNMRKQPLTLISLKQIDINPPTFRLVSPQPKEVAPAIMHVIEKRIRQQCHFTGVPITLILRNS
ncbi:MAG: ribosome biogenesis GTPase Der [Candidatus Kerfeldbacteria bacterium]|nr:ribosome biogenesis GTPase Der [Candidatus Kerfeldbacteria bacterium]